MAPYSNFYFYYIVLLFFSDVAPILKQDKVCDLIVEAIRKNQHMLLIPKTLNISLVLGGLEDKNIFKKK
jgi:hypothetical protein